MVSMQTLLPAAARAESGGFTSEDAGPDLHGHYGTGWLDSGGVRVNFISSTDGAAAAGGKSRGLQTPGDNRVFAVLRDLADVVLVGAATARTEGYRPIDLSPDRRRLRTSLGLAENPATAVMSNSLDLDLSADLYRNARSDSPTLIVTGSAAPMAPRTDIIDLAASDSALQLVQAPSGPDGGVDFAAAVAQLAERGYRRILCEGGPRLFAAGVTARAVDELCLTVSPMLAGPGAPRIVTGPKWPADFLPQLTLTGLLLEDDALFCRYAIHH
jgi:riboflavin biosynthesis pyrimidine reductase